MNSKLNMHERAVEKLVKNLRRFQHYCKKSPMTGTKNPDESYYDLLVDGKIRCEVKSTILRRANRSSKGLSWNFNLHRHGVLNPRPLEVYALHCGDGGNGTWFFVPACELNGQKTVYITPRTIAKRWGCWVDRYDLFGNGTQTVT